jgi:uncharacterized protein DUF4339
MATEAKWFYARGGKQLGPISAEELKGLVALGHVEPADMVWHEGMPAWTRAAEVAELIAWRTTNGVQTGQPIPVGYYTSTLGFPPRAAATLRGHAPPRGDTGDWPLDDARVSHFEETVKLRKKITAAASLYKSLLALTAISLAVTLAISIFTASSSGNPATRMGIATLPINCVMLGFGLLYFFAFRATRNSRRWAPLTMFCVFIASGIFQIISVALAAARPASMTVFTPNMVGPMVVLFITLMFVSAFASVSWRAIAAIPKYLAQPAWCQELIVKAGL